MAQPTLCVRCLTPTAATTSVVVAHNDTRYRLDLCDPHADRLQTDMFAWTRLGEILDVAPEPAREVGGEIVASHIATGVHPALAATVENGGLNHQLTPVNDGQALVGMWRLTVHAHDRAAERLVSPQEAINAATAPTRVLPSDKPGLQVRIRGSIKTVVNLATHEILTVARRDA